MKLINIGYGNYVSADRVVTVVSPEAAPVRRLVQDSRDSGRLIDASCGKKTRSVVVADSGHVILSALTPEALASRLNGGAKEDAEQDHEDSPEDGEQIEEN